MRGSIRLGGDTTARRATTHLVSEVDGDRLILRSLVPRHVLHILVEPRVPPSKLRRWAAAGESMLQVRMLH